MINVNKCYHYGIVHCPYCAGSGEFDFALAMQEGQFVNIECPWCGGLYSIDIYGQGVYHRIVNPVDEAFK